MLTGRYWFVTIYIGLYLIAPFLNIGIRAMTRRQHQTLLALLFLLFSVMVSIWPGFAGMNSGGGWGLAWFVVLYLAAAYLRLYYHPTGKCGRYAIIFFACPVIMTGVLWVSQQLGIGTLEKIADNWWRYDSVFAFAATLALMLAFLNRRGTKNGRINRAAIRLSSATFGVYLIHAHADLCTEEMWGRLGIVSSMGHAWWPLYQLAVVAAIFLVCAAIDLLRQKLFALLKADEHAVRIGTALRRCLNRLQG